MAEFFKVQQQLRQKFGLEKIIANRNPNYKAHGLKSYVYLMNRFNFEPTQPGPYVRRNTFQQRGLAHSKVARGGRIHVQQRLVKKPTADAGDQEAGEVTADDQQNDSMYLCEVQIGTPAQTLNLDFDTGSSDLWVFSTLLSSDLQGSGHNIFDPSKSSTWKNEKELAWKIQYGDGSSASGTVGTDLVSIGGLQIQNQAVELAEQLADQFSQSTGDGLLGLAFPAINTITNGGSPDPQPTPVVNMISQKDIPQGTELFTSAFYSERDAGAKSFYTFGWIDEDLVKQSGQDIVYTDIDNSEGFWQFSSESATIGTKKLTQQGNKAIADTGTTLMLVSDEVCKALYGAIKGAKYDDSQQGWLIPKGVTDKDLPDFSVAVGDNQFSVQKEDLLFTLADEDHYYGGVQSRGTNPFDIFGDTFLKSVYAIWDQGNNRFGAVPKIQQTQNLAPPASGPDGNQ